MTRIWGKCLHNRKCNQTFSSVLFLFSFFTVVVTFLLIKKSIPLIKISQPLTAVSSIQCFILKMQPIPIQIKRNIHSVLYYYLIYTICPLLSNSVVITREALPFITFWNRMETVLKKKHVDWNPFFKGLSSSKFAVFIWVRFWSIKISLKQ